ANAPPKLGSSPRPGWNGPVEGNRNTRISVHVAVSQSRNVLSGLAVTRRLPSGLQATAQNTSWTIAFGAYPGKGAGSLRVSTFQMWTRSSSAATARRSPSGDNETIEEASGFTIARFSASLTAKVNFATDSPVLTFQTLTVPSSPADARRLLSL